MEIKRDNNVLLVAGRINAGTGKTLFWKVESKPNTDEFEKNNCAIGDYMIVENDNGYDLAKIAGVVETTKEKASYFSNTKYENMKRAIGVISKEKVEI